MDKTKTVKKIKAKYYTTKYKDEFMLGPKDQLYCKICASIIMSERKSTVEKHRKTKKHEEGLSFVKNNSSSTQTQLYNLKDSFMDRLVRAFLSADIPLYKLRNTQLRAILNENNNHSISESAARNHVETIFMNNCIELMEYFKSKNFFIIIDETEIKKKKYFNVLAGTIENPKRILAIKCVELEGNINSVEVVALVESALENIKMNFSNLKIVISDRASYMMKAMEMMKGNGRNFFHVQCLAHLVHNCAMRIKSYYRNVDALIGSIKMLTHKNNTILNMFSDFEKPPSVIITRWSSWLRAAIYYCNNLPKIIIIMDKIKPEGILYSRALEALNDKTLIIDLVKIKRSYEFLINVLDGFENSKYNIETGYNEIAKIFISEDSVGINEYIVKIISKNDIKKIVALNDNTISPTDYQYLLNCPPTSIAVERSFSMLKKMLASDRNFSKENIIKYFMVYYNSGNSVYEEETEEDDV